MPVVAMGIGFNTPSDGQVINGVAHFVRPTAPSVRNDGSALQDNDRWYDSSTGRQWIRKGIYWLGERIIVGAGAQGATNINSSTNFQSDDVIPFSNIYVEFSSLTFFANDRTQTLAEHWDITWGFTWYSASSVNFPIQTLATDTQDGGLLINTGYRFNATPNSAYLGLTTTNLHRAMAVLTKTGTNINRIAFSASLTYREIYA